MLVGDGVFEAQAPRLIRRTIASQEGVRVANFKVIGVFMRSPKGCRDLVCSNV